MSKLKNKKPKKSLDEALQATLEASPSEIKVQTIVRLDSDIYMELKKRAKAGESHGKYQRLMNDILRAALFKSEGDDIKARIEKLEKVVFSKRK